jgi:hypothetical protein
MKSNFRWEMLAGAMLALVITGCGKKADASRELEKAVSSMGSAEAVPAPAPAQPQPAQPVQPAPVPVAAPATAPAQQVNQALAAYKAGNLDDAVTRLQKLRATSALTPQQRIALNDAMAAVMTDIYALAAKGDARAIQAVKQSEQMQTQKR